MLLIDAVLRIATELGTDDLDILVDALSSVVKARRQLEQQVRDEIDAERK